LPANLSSPGYLILIGTDHGLCNGPADDEQGHTENCARHAATVAAWNAEWEAADAEWEAGQ
jgi:hypothetical protein